MSPQRHRARPDDPLLSETERKLRDDLTETDPVARCGACQRPETRDPDVERTSELLTAGDGCWWDPTFGWRDDRTGRFGPHRECRRAHDDDTEVLATEPVRLRVVLAPESPPQLLCGRCAGDALPWPRR